MSFLLRNGGGAAWQAPPAKKQIARSLHEDSLAGEAGAVVLPARQPHSARMLTRTCNACGGMRTCRQPHLPPTPAAASPPFLASSVSSFSMQPYEPPQTDYLREEVGAARALAGDLDMLASACLSFREKAQELSEATQRALSRLQQVHACVWVLNVWDGEAAWSSLRLEWSRRRAAQQHWQSAAAMAEQRRELTSPQCALQLS